MSEWFEKMLHQSIVTFEKNCNEPILGLNLRGFLAFMNQRF